MISSQKHKKRYFMPEIELYGLLIGIGRRDFFYFRSGFSSKCIDLLAYLMLVPGSEL